MSWRCRTCGLKYKDYELAKRCCKKNPEEKKEKPKVMREVKFCLMCNKELAFYNLSGYCVKCYKKSPEFLERVRIYSKERYNNPLIKKQRHEYNISPRVRERTKQYNKKYFKEHSEHIRELKREWARRNKHRRKKTV